MSPANAFLFGINVIKIMKDAFVVLCSEDVLALSLYPCLKRNLHYLIMYALFQFTFQILLIPLQFLRFCFHFFYSHVITFW